MMINLFPLSFAIKTIHKALNSFAREWCRELWTVATIKRLPLIETPKNYLHIKSRLLKVKK